MFATIVAGTDGSPTASAAVGRAMQLARQCGARLHLVTAYKPIELLGARAAAEAIPPNLYDLIDPAGDAASLVEAAADRARGEGVEVETHTVPGGAAEAIVDVAETVGADCIVVGSRGMTGAARFLLGSVPNRVAHHAPCTVMIVRTS